MTSTQLEAVFGSGNTAEAEAAIRGVVDRRFRKHAEAVVVDLAKMGVHGSDLAHALEAVRRIHQGTGWDVPRCSEFVAATMAVGAIRGPAILLIPNLARIAAGG